MNGRNDTSIKADSKGSKRVKDVASRPSTSRPSSTSQPQIDADDDDPDVDDDDDDDNDDNDVKATPAPAKKVVTTSSYSQHPWGIFFTILGTVLLDFDADACQSPSRAYLLDVTVPGEP